MATKRDFEVFATQMRSEMAVLRSDLRAEMAELRGEMKGQTTRILFWLVPTIIAGMGVAARLG